MKRTAAWLALVALATGCASNSSTIGSRPLLAIDPAAVEGTWALTDERNQTFNVILREDGSATSTWSRGMDGAKGEQGGWSIREGVLYVRWTDGWLDTIRVGRYGFEKFSYEPSDREGDTPSSFGQAVKITDDSEKWVGVWRTSSSTSVSTSTSTSRNCTSTRNSISTHTSNSRNCTSTSNQHLHQLALEGSQGR